jgi:hypothetical protein
MLKRENGSKCQGQYISRVEEDEIRSDTAEKAITSEFCSPRESKAACLQVEGSTNAFTT